MHVVLSGSVRIGKTTICQDVIGQAQSRGYCVSGVLTPPILGPTGQRHGIEVVDLITGERRVLARVMSHEDRSQSSSEGQLYPALHSQRSPTALSEHAFPGLAHSWTGPRVGDYQFDSAALQWGQDAVARSVAMGCDLLVVDEIGRLELEHSDGFAQVLDLLEIGIVQRSLLVVRTELLDKFQRRLPRLQFVTFEATSANRRYLASAIMDQLFSSGPAAHPLSMTQR
jgi:nucleoside-triphosphatase THEP1